MTFTILDGRCEKCGARNVEQVINASDSVRAGWYCVECKHFTKAIGRERIVEGVLRKDER